MYHIVVPLTSVVSWWMYLVFGTSISLALAELGVVLDFIIILVLAPGTTFSLLCHHE